MSSADDEPRTLHDLESLLDEHGVDPALAERIREILGLTTGVKDASRTRPSRSPVLAGADTLAGQDDANATVLARPQSSSPRNPSVGRPSQLPLASAERLEPLVLLASGGMGEIHRVLDRALDRHLAMKVLHERFVDADRMRDSFLLEAQITAQLAHPSIPPVHELGELDDARPFFTMKEVHGRTLADVIDELAANDAPSEQSPSEQSPSEQWSERRRLEVFQRVCEAVAYAHARGVVHCDLKPLNVMVGAFGEVLVMDWGVARLVEPARSDATREPPVRPRAGLDTVEVVAGTPAYMPPEQATGEALGPPADVYALGVMLFELLALERPYQGSAAQVLWQSLAGPAPALPRRPHSIVDEALTGILQKAMAPKPEDRYPDAAPLAADIARWREGAIRREKALSLVREARAALPSIEPLEAEARSLRAEAEAELAELGRTSNIAQKMGAWELEDRAASLEQGARLRIVEVEQLLQGALVHAPELDEAKSLLARIYHARHRSAEDRRDWDEAALHEVLLRAHDVGEHRDYLGGTARLSIRTSVPCAARLHRFVLRGRRMVPEHVRDVGETPIDVQLPVGSYLVELSSAQAPSVRYPVVLRRTEGWDSAHPSSRDPSPTERAVGERGEVDLSAAASLARGEIFVPSGWFLLGGDAQASNLGRSGRVWLDGFVIREHPITFREIAEFLADPAGAPHRQHVVRDGIEVWRPDWPAVGVSWFAANAYAAWLSERTGVRWRLPTELEWEKAARGVDGRFYPWGDFADGMFCHARSVDRTPQSPVSVHSNPTDVSPYGLRGAGGNVRDWCADAFDPSGPEAEGDRRAHPAARSGSGPRAVRGGSWRQNLDGSRVAARGFARPELGYPDVGFRLARDGWS